VSRMEEKNKRYMSNAFERDRKTRKDLYEKKLLDGEVDVLLTHSPPAGILCWNETNNFMGPGDPILRAHLDTLKSPPKFHCFGHDHDYFGVSQNKETTFLNAANQQFLCNECEWGESWRSGGCPLIFDVLLETKRGRIGSME
jgi:Icc-related predicted phosphoesterase